MIKRCNMKKVKGLFMTLIIGLLYRPSLLMAQGEELYIEESMEAADSSHMEIDFMADAVAKNSGSVNTLIIILAVLVVLGAVAFFIYKKKKKDLSTQQS